MAVAPVAAATVVVLRDSPLGPEVLMVRRHERSGDFAGASVFPGGLVDPQDADPDLVPAETGFVVESAVAALGEVIPEATARALHVAACRELFEEANMLLARRPHGEPIGEAALERSARLRFGLQAGTESLKSVLERENAVLALDALLPFARWITPEFQPRRWDARFFLVEAPAGQIALCDGTETCEAVWLRPEAALAAYRAGEHMLAPPTFRVLEDLQAYTSVPEAFAALRRAGPPRPILPVSLAGAELVTLVYPGDRDYPGDIATGLNRLVLRDGRWQSERSDG
jgi:8-oxo-dGTP pyrophosphatase MutT (NUDIX family)